MKLQSVELPLRKQQIRRKTPKIASLIILTILLSVISVYSPSLRFKKDSEASSPLDSIKESINSSALSNPRENEPCLDGSQPCSYKGEDEVLEAPKGITEKDGENRPNSEKEERGPPSIIKTTDSSAAETFNKTSETSWASPSQVTNSDYETLNAAEEIGGEGKKINSKGEEKCDLFSGEWVPNPEAPYYTNSTCFGVQEHQNCMKYGRPDTEFLKWRWKPDGCELPIFDPQQFLELVRGKSIAFVGDSVARNHMQSLICLLSRVVYPQEISNTTDENRQWEYKDYNFKISIFWAPYLVRYVEITGPNDPTRSFSLYLDEFDENWTKKMQEYDYVVISAGHWFFRPTMFYENHGLLGCQYCSQDNIPRLTTFFSYQKAFRTAFRAINSLQNFKGVIILRTFAPSHFENGTWNNGGNCPRTTPYKRNEIAMTDFTLEMYKIQMEELRIAEEEGRKRGLKFRLFDATKTMLLRPDGHPSKYGHWPSQNVELPNDCVHWCLPGPIDTWSDFLLELLKREEFDKSVA